MKRNIITLFFFLLSLLIFVSCQKEQKAIEAAAYGYLDAMGNYRIKDAEKFATPETIEQTLHVIDEVIMPLTDSNYIKSNTPASIEITEITINTDTTAIVKYKKTTPIQVQEGELKLVKQNKKWLAEVFINLPGILTIPQNCKESQDNTYTLPQRDTTHLKVAENPIFKEE